MLLLRKVFNFTCEKQVVIRNHVLIKSTAGAQVPIFPLLRYKKIYIILTLKVTALTMKNLSHGTPCAVKAACTVWTLSLIHIFGAGGRRSGGHLLCLAAVCRHRRNRLDVHSGCRTLCRLRVLHLPRHDRRTGAVGVVQV